MALSVKRDLLNSSFETYRLSSDRVLSSRVDLEEKQWVRVVEKKDMTTYYHMWLLKLHNYFILDPWNLDAVYWFSQKYEVVKGTVTADGSAEATKVFHTRNPGIYLWAMHAGLYASFVFISEYYCLFTSGIGDLLLIHTGKRGEGEAWTNVLDMVLDKPPDKVNSCLKIGYHMTILLNAKLEEDGRTLQVVSMVVTDPQKEQESKLGQPNVCNLKWYTLVFNQPIGGPDKPKEDPALSFTFEKHFALSSVAIPLYTTFLDEYLVVVIERDLTGSVYEEEKDRDERHKKLGYQDMHQQDDYSWQQNKNREINIVVDLPDEVGKEDIRCEFHRSKISIGLNDGTSYIKGDTFAELDTEACFWTVDTERQVLEILLTKQGRGEWRQLFKDPPKPPPDSDSDSSDEGMSLACGKRSGMRSGLRRALRMPKLRRPKPLFFFDQPKKETGPPPKRTRPVLMNTAEEVYDEDKDDATLFLINKEGGCCEKTGFEGKPFLFSCPTGPLQPPAFAIQHDVDALMCSLAFDDQQEGGGLVSCHHDATFNALASVQESKKNRKYVACNAKMDLSVLTDCSSLVQIYKHSTPTDTVADMSVFTLPDVEDPKGLGLSQIHGVHITPGGDIFVLRKGSLFVLRVSSSST